MKNVKLNGMSKLVKELNAWEYNRGWYVSITLELATGKIWGTPCTSHTWSPDEKGYASVSSNAFREDEDGREVSHSTRNAAIRAWAKSQLN